MVGMEMIIAGSVTPRSTPHGRWGACAGLTTTRAAKSRMSVRTAGIRALVPNYHATSSARPIRVFAGATLPGGKTWRSGTLDQVAAAPGDECNSAQLWSSPSSLTSSTLRSSSAHDHVELCCLPSVILAAPSANCDEFVVRPAAQGLTEFLAIIFHCLQIIFESHRLRAVKFRRGARVTDSDEKRSYNALQRECEALRSVLLVCSCPSSP